MKKTLFTVLIVLGLSSVIVLGSTIAIVQPIFASLQQETDGETDSEPQDQSGGEDGSEVSEPELEPETPQDDGQQSTVEPQVGTEPVPLNTSSATNQSGSSGYSRNRA